MHQTNENTSLQAGFEPSGHRILLEMERGEIHRDQFEWFDVLFEINGASQWQFGMGLVDVPFIDSAQGQVSLSDEDITVEYAFSFVG